IAEQLGSDRRAETRVTDLSEICPKQATGSLELPQPRSGIFERGPSLSESCPKQATGSLELPQPRSGVSVGARELSEICPKRARPRDIWSAVRERLVWELARIVDAMPGPRERVVRDHFLFTVIAAAWSGDEVAVWALGDGGYAIGDRVVALGPFANNA